MRGIGGRLTKLEHQLGIARGAARYLLIVMEAGRELGPAEDAHIKSLDEAGLLPSSGFGLVDLIHIPDRREGTAGAALEISVELL